MEMNQWWIVLGCCILVHIPSAILTDMTHPSQAFLPQGPPRPPSSFLLDSSVKEPQPPSIEGIDLELKAPAPPPDGEGPQPPAPPDPHELSLFEIHPDHLTDHSHVQVQQRSSGPKEKRSESQHSLKSSLSYEQFLTAALRAGLDLQNQVYTLLSPSDQYLEASNLTRLFLDPSKKDCIDQIIRQHAFTGKLYIDNTTEDVLLSLEETPIFISGNDANGASIIESNVEMGYGVAHILNRFMDDGNLVETCLKSRDPSDSPNVIHQDPAPIAPVYEKQILDTFEVKENDINVKDPPARDPTYRDPSQVVHSDSNVPLDLLAKIDNFALAMKLTWQTEDSVIAILQRLGASTFLALLERSKLMETLTNQGPWTIFVPGNDAWQSLPKETFDYIMRNPEILRQILTYHISATNVTRQVFRNNMALPSLNQGFPIHINFYSDGWASWYTASGSQIVNLDERASNGVIHVVQSVLLPPHGDLNMTIHATPALQMFASLIQKTEDLPFFNDTLTAFLPVDSPMLNEALHADIKTLTEIIRHHVVRGIWFVSGLVDGDQLYTFNNKILTVSHEGNCIRINEACIVVRDITLTNGVLHVIDKLI